MSKIFTVWLEPEEYDRFEEISKRTFRKKPDLFRKWIHENYTT